MDNLFGRTRTVTTPDDREWTLGRLRVGVIHAFAAWIKKQEGDPFALVERYLGKIPDAELMPLFREAKEISDQLRAFSLMCPLAIKHLSREEGSAELYRLLLEEHHKGVSLDDALGVFLADSVTLAEAIRHAEGSPPNAVAPAAAA